MLMDIIWMLSFRKNAQDTSCIYCFGWKDENMDEKWKTNIITIILTKFSTYTAYNYKYITHHMCSEYNKKIFIY